MNTELFALLYLSLGFLSAMVGGVFLSFSDFVMRGFAQADRVSAIDCMQGLNKTVFKSIFLFCFIGMVPLTIVIAMITGEFIAYITAAVYILLVFLTTVMGNVPMNEKLERSEKSSQDAGQYWETYAVNWTRWNHVRTLGSFITSVLYLVASL
ncbi:MAG: DUF1772 domain-containing protein [Pseudobacteriovorax sp.]|nr:DUF1772 domain-containing protein [Pseudobacteriovorax sp.]